MRREKGTEGHLDLFTPFFPSLQEYLPQLSMSLPIRQTQAACAAAGEGGAEGMMACWSRDWWGFSLGNC